MGYIGSLLYKKVGGIGIDVREGRNLLTCYLPDDITLVYHLAAQSDVQASWEDPVHDAQNLAMTARLVKKYPRAKIVYANSCAAINRNSPYGFSKWASAEYLKKFHTNSVICVFPNIYGGASRSVVDTFKSKAEVTVYGDGKQTRDYVHVDDIVAGLVKAARWSPGEYFMGSGISTNVLQLAQGKEITFAPERQEDREVEVPNTTPDWRITQHVNEYMKC